MKKKLNYLVAIIFLLLLSNGYSQNYSARFLLYPWVHKKAKYEKENFYLVNLNRIAHSSKLKIVLGYYQRSTDYSNPYAENINEKGILIIPRFYVQDENNGFNFGFMYLKISGGEFDGFAFPVVGYRRNFGQKYYATIDLVDEDLPAFLSLSFGYKPNYKNLDFRFGLSIQDKILLHIKMNYNIFNFIPIGLNYGYNMFENEHSLFFFLGIKI